MKHKLMLLAAMALAPAAHADSWEQPNTAGGKIVLTDRVCDGGKYKDLLEAYAYLPNGEVTNGCWGPLDSKAHISWNNGKQSVFPLNVFTANPANKRGKTAATPL